MKSKFLFILLSVSLVSCVAQSPRAVYGPEEIGYASWYGKKFQGRKTASGEPYDMNEFTAAHRKAPFGSMVRVTNLVNERSVKVRINDRGPFVSGRIIDLSYAAAKDLGLIEVGSAKVRLDFISSEVEPKSSKALFLQVGSFRDASNADRMLDQVVRDFPKQKGKIQTQEGFHRVWLGPYANESEAVEWVEKLQASGYRAFILHR